MLKRFTPTTISYKEQDDLLHVSTMITPDINKIIDDNGLDLHNAIDDKNTCLMVKYYHNASITIQDNIITAKHGDHIWQGDLDGKNVQSIKTTVNNNTVISDVYVIIDCEVVVVYVIDLDLTYWLNS